MKRILKDLGYALLLYGGCLGMLGGAFYTDRGFGAPGMETAIVVVEPIPLCTDGGHNDSIFNDPDTLRDLATEGPWVFQEQCDSAVALLRAYGTFDTLAIYPPDDTIYPYNNTETCVADTLRFYEWVWDSIANEYVAGPDTIVYGDTIKAHPGHIHPTSCSTQLVAAVYQRQDTIPLSIRYRWASQAGAARVTTSGGDTILVEPYDVVYYRVRLWAADYSTDWDTLLTDTIVVVSDGVPDLEYRAMAQACGVLGADSVCTIWGDSVSVPFPHPMITNQGLVPPVVIPDTMNSIYQVDK
jgi:hypothetical protein